jgi:hypothetical protein
MQEMMNITEMMETQDIREVLDTTTISCVHSLAMAKMEVKK